MRSKDALRILGRVCDVCDDLPFGFAQMQIQLQIQLQILPNINIITVIFENTVFSQITLNKAFHP